MGHDAPVFEHFQLSYGGPRLKTTGTTTRALAGCEGAKMHDGVAADTGCLYDSAIRWFCLNCHHQGRGANLETLTRSCSGFLFYTTDSHFLQYLFWFSYNLNVRWLIVILQFLVLVLHSLYK
jgi:hypothetical protein